MFSKKRMPERIFAYLNEKKSESLLYLDKPYTQIGKLTYQSYYDLSDKNQIILMHFELNAKKIYLLELQLDAYGIIHGRENELKAHYYFASDIIKCLFDDDMKHIYGALSLITKLDLNQKDHLNLPPINKETIEYRHILKNNLLDESQREDLGEKLEAQFNDSILYY